MKEDKDKAAETGNSKGLLKIGMVRVSSVPLKIGADRVSNALLKIGMDRGHSELLKIEMDRGHSDHHNLEAIARVNPIVGSKTTLKTEATNPTGLHRERRVLTKTNKSIIVKMSALTAGVFIFE